MVYVSLADMALHGRNRKRIDSLSTSLRRLYPSYGNFVLSSVLFGHPTAYDTFASLLSLFGIPRVTLARGYRRLSPVDMTSLYCVNGSPAPPRQVRLAFSPFPVLPSASLNASTRGFERFGVLYHPCSLTSHALPRQLPAGAQGSLPVVWLLPFRAGFPPACMSCPCWAHEGRFLCPNIRPPAPAQFRPR